MSHSSFERTLRKLIEGELPIQDDFNEYVGHADAVRLLLEVAPDAIRDDLRFLHELLIQTRDASGAGVLGIFPQLTDPELANVEGRISDYVAEHCKIRLDDGDYEAGKLVGEFHDVPVAVKAFIVLADGYTGDATLAAEIKQSVKERLSAHEYPREVEFIDALPMTTTGKVRRIELRAREAARRGA